MTHHQSPPPSDAEACLCRRYSSSQKGGTVIVESVLCLEEHERRLNGGGYRLAGCPRCGLPVHQHDLRPRVMVTGAGSERVRSVTETQRLRCSDRERCGAAWQMLPAFLARHLWRRWATVERAMLGRRPERCEDKAAGSRAPVVPPKTESRWRGRLVSAAALVVTVIASTNRPELVAIAGAVGVDGTREQFVTEYAQRLKPPPGQRLANPAGLLHRLAPGVRLM